MPISIYAKLTDEIPTTTRIRLSFAGHSYVYPLGIAEDVLVTVAGFMFPVDFMIIDDREGEYMPIILGAPFLTTARAVIKYEKGIIEFKSGQRRIRFHMTPRDVRRSMLKSKVGDGCDVPCNHVREKILAWEVRVKCYKEIEIGNGEGRDRNSIDVEI
jgi:hypothetical protein